MGEVKKCDVCNNKKSTVFKEVGEHTYVTCVKCGTIYLTTREINLTKARETYLENVDQYLSIINPHGTRYLAGNVDHAFERLFSGRGKGKLLEIGSGMGHLSYMLFSRGWEVSSLELSDAAKDWADKVFKLPTYTEKIEDFRQKDFDAFVMVEVIEHLYDPLAALKHIKKLSTKNAMIFGTTPNIDSKHWETGEQDIYQPHDHIVLFSKSSLRQLLQKAGYKKISIEYFGGGEKNDSNLMYSAIIR